MHNIPMAVGYMYYMKLMLNNIRGATYFEVVRTVNSVCTDVTTIHAVLWVSFSIMEIGEYISGLKEASL